MTARTVQIHMLSMVAHSLALDHKIPRLAADWFTMRCAAKVADMTTDGSRANAGAIALALLADWRDRNGEAKADFRRLYNDAANRVL